MPVSDDGSGKDLERRDQDLGRLNAWKEFDGLVERAISAHPENAALLHTRRGDLPAMLRTPGGSSPGSSSATEAATEAAEDGPDAMPEASAGPAVDTDYRDHIRSLQLSVRRLIMRNDGGRSAGIWRDMAELFRRTRHGNFRRSRPSTFCPSGANPDRKAAPRERHGRATARCSTKSPHHGRRRKTTASAGVSRSPNRSRLEPEETRGCDDHLSSPAFRDPSSARKRFRPSVGGGSRIRIAPRAFSKWTRSPRTNASRKPPTASAVSNCPPTHHFIALYRSILDRNARPAGDALVEVFLNRRQYDKAREVLEQTIAKHGPGNNDQPQEAPQTNHRQLGPLRTRRDRARRREAQAAARLPQCD